jgi:signal transduction histidine kinase
LYREARDAETQLTQLNAQLEQRVQARTAELERSNRDLDRFAYVASHDLKAPLRAIQHLAQWIHEDAADHLPDPSKAHLAKLHDRIMRMEKLLDDLLAYSRVDRFHYPPERLDTKLLSKNVLDMLAPPATFRITLHESLPTFVTARVPLEIVLRNLIGNAIKHHHRLDGQIEIYARQQDDAIEFVVADDGPGIDQQFHERIFELFQTLHPRDQVEGSGMGLAIAKKVVEHYGGSIGVESREGQGAIFYFTWPRVPSG